MKDKMLAIKKHLVENADDYTILLSMTALGLIGMSFAANRAKWKTANDLMIVSARDFINNDTGEISDLYITHRDGGVTVLKSRTV